MLEEMQEQSHTFQFVIGNDQGPLLSGINSRIDYLQQWRWYKQITDHYYSFYSRLFLKWISVFGEFQICMHTH